MAKTCSAFGKYIPPFASDAASFCSPALSITIYSRFLLFLHPLSFRPCMYVCTFFLFRPVARAVFLLLRLLVFDHHRCYQTTCTLGPQADFLPAVILFRPSCSLSLCPARGLTRPLRRRTVVSLIPPAVIYLFAVVPFPFLLDTWRCILWLFTAVRHVLLPLLTTSYCYYFPGHRTNPFLSVCLLAMMQRRFINFRDANQ